MSRTHVTILCSRHSAPAVTLGKAGEAGGVARCGGWWAVVAGGRGWVVLRLWGRSDPCSGRTGGQHKREGRQARIRGVSLSMRSRRTLPRNKPPRPSLILFSLYIDIMATLLKRLSLNYERRGRDESAASRTMASTSSFNDFSLHIGQDGERGPPGGAVGSGREVVRGLGFRLTLSNRLSACSGRCSPRIRRGSRGRCLPGGLHGPAQRHPLFRGQRSCRCGTCPRGLYTSLYRKPQRPQTPPCPSFRPVRRSCQLALCLPGPLYAPAAP